jgi:hypothetical protein
MRPSSTSSSEPQVQPRRWRTFAIVVLAALATVEVALRSPHLRSVLPPRTHFYHPAITTRLDALERMVRDHRRVDVLFIGSSIVLTNLHPQVFDSVVPQRGPGVSFNAGLPGLWPTSVHLYAEHLWLPAARPRLVVQGIRYPELATSTHAKHETQVWSGTIESSWRESDLLTQAYASLVSHVFLLQYRGAVARVLERYRHGWSDPNEFQWDGAYEKQGYEPISDMQAMPQGMREADLPNDGLCEEERCAVGFGALRRTIAAARVAGSQYVLLNVPEHASRWRGLEGLSRYQHYLEQLRGFAAAEKVDFIDPTEGDPFRFEQMPYADLAHMTEAGSRQFTKAVALHFGTLVTTARRNGETLDVRGLNCGDNSIPCVR